jgi:hypothetical protein
LIDRAIEEGFVLPRYRKLLVVSSEIEELFERLFAYQPLESIVKWIDVDEA